MARYFVELIDKKGVARPSIINAETVMKDMERFAGYQIIYVGQPVKPDGRDILLELECESDHRLIKVRKTPQGGFLVFYPHGGDTHAICVYLAGPTKTVKVLNFVVSEHRAKGVYDSLFLSLLVDKHAHLSVRLKSMALEILGSLATGNNRHHTIVDRFGERLSLFMDTRKSILGVRSKRTSFSSPYGELHHLPI